MDQTQAQTYAAQRGYGDWTALDEEQQAQALLRADDYIVAHYTLRIELNPTEQARRDAAQFLIARDLANNPLPLRAEAAITKESKEAGDFKKAVEYADAPSDPYPQATALLAPLRVNAGASGVVIGRLVR